MKNLIRKILKEEHDSDWDWVEEVSNTIPGKELKDFIRNNNLTEIPDHIKYVEGDLNLYNRKIKSLGNLESVEGNLYLGNTTIKSLGNLQSVGGDFYLDLENSQIKSLGNLQSVGGDLNLENTQIKSLGNLESVEGNLYLEGTPISKKYSEQEIRNMVDVGGNIFL